MNNSHSIHSFIPITHIIFAATGISITTAIAYQLHQELLFIYTLCGLLLCALVAQPKHWVAYFCILFFAWHTGNNIQTRTQNFNVYREYLKTPVTLHATIAQKNNNAACKDQVVIILKHCQIQKSFYKKLPTTKNIMLLMPAKSAQKLHPGQEILIRNALLQQPEPSADFYQYLIKENIWATTFINQQNIIILKKHESLMNQCYAIFSSLLHPENTQLFDPLFLGKRDKTVTSIFIQHQSAYWGIAHHMARSGIHLVTLLSLFLGIFHILRIRYWYRYIICSILALFYFQISIANISFMRALVMMLIQMFSRLNQFNYSSTHALALTTLVIVMQNPFVIFFLDFQLSFGITAVIIWLFNKKYAQTIVLASNNPLPL